MTGVLAVTMACATFCTPELGDDRPPDVMEFDPSGDPPRSPEPNGVVINPETGLIDLSVLGKDLPTYATDCQQRSTNTIAQCEFDMYLQTLDGFPSVSPVRAPMSAEPNLTTFLESNRSTPGNLLVIDWDAGEFTTGLHLGWRPKTEYMTLESPTGWELGHRYIFAIRGYDNGVTAVDGNRIVSSSAYFMFKQAESLLTCAPDNPFPTPVQEQQIDPQCKWWKLMEMQFADPVVAAESLVALEQIRQSFLDPDMNVWDILSQIGDMPREEVAIVWTFPIHSASVVELNPTTGTVPVVASNTELRLPAKGPIDPDTLIPFDILGPPLPGDKGTVILLNLTALQAGDTFNGFPEFTVALTTDGSIGITTAAPMADGNLYGILLTVPSVEDEAPRNGVTSPDGRPIVPSPVTVLLRSRGPVVDANGTSNVSGITDADGAELEEGRLQLIELLEDPTFTSAARVTRENIAYLYAFEFPNP